MYVYIYPAQTTNGIYPLGGDVRYLISADGSSIVEKRQMRKTILEYDFSASSSIKEVNYGFHTHILSDVPEDTDVSCLVNQTRALGQFGNRPETTLGKVGGLPTMNQKESAGPVGTGSALLALIRPAQQRRGHRKSRPRGRQ